MTKRVGYKGDSRCDKAAQDAFTSEGGFVAREPAAGKKHADAVLADRERLISEFSIQYDSRHYKRDGYRHDRLGDAVGLSWLVHSRQSPDDRGVSLTCDDGVESGLKELQAHGARSSALLIEEERECLF